jgi:16S rRNA (guanine527-N7)-methyltransferase
MERIKKYFPDLTQAQLQQLEMLQPLYTDWNNQINVISRKDIENIYLHHVLHSLAIARVITFVPGTKVLDVGTGGGFPGIPLAILFPEVSFLLVDSIGKKIKVVKEVAAALGLTNVDTAVSRAEQIKTQFDFVVSRAVTQLPVFVPWVRKNISGNSHNAIKNGILYLKGGDISAELQPFSGLHEVYPISAFFDEDFFKEKLVIHMFR